MEYRTSSEIKRVADVFRTTPAAVGLSRAERLTRWAELLKQDPDRKLKTLHGTEFVLREDRELLRSDQLPITVAFEDRLFRAEGLRNDTYGEAKRFFELSDRQLHKVLCHCHFGPTVSADVVAQRVAGIATRPVGPIARAWRVLINLRQSS
jgi:hypothetical protein